MPVFVDSNVLVYTRDVTEKAKQPLAEAWMRSLWASRTGRLSIQVLHEFYVTTTQKLKPGLRPEEARRDIRDLLAWHPLPLDGQLVEAAWSVQDAYSVSVWDSLIVAAALKSGCELLLTEDLQDGHVFGPTTVINPFTHDPSEVAR